MAIADQLTEISTNLGLINNEVTTQEDLITQIKFKLENSLISGSTGSGSVFSGTVTTNSEGEAVIPYPGFTPQYMIIWNIIKIDQWEEEGDTSLVRYRYDGVMLCAIRLSDERWISQYMKNASGVAYIAQASVDISPYPTEQNYPHTNVWDDGSSITWDLGSINENESVHDFTNITFNYVLVG